MKKVGVGWGTGVCIGQTYTRRTCTLGELVSGELDWVNLYWAKDPRPMKGVL